MVFNKKAISPVVATALLLVVAVVAVVGFQAWFNTYQSGLQTQAESQSAAVVTIERLEATAGNIYIKNGGDTAVSASQIRVTNSSGTQQCVKSTSSSLTASTVSNFSISGCGLLVGTTYNVIVVTGDGVFSEEEIAR